jgi:hypothetical protein
MSVPPKFTNFDISHATVSVWLFKKWPPMNGMPRFSGHWIDTDTKLDAALKGAITAERDRITEVMEYGLLAQNNEGSAMRVDAIETHAGLITQQTGAETQQKKVMTKKHIENTKFYVIKLKKGADILWAVRKTDSSWTSKNSLGVINAFFKDVKLTLDTTPSFRLSRKVDFFIIGDDIIVSKKAAFESVLGYKQAHEEDFIELQAEPQFSSLFETIDPIVAFIGNNKIHLRRACAIHAKGHYKNPQFMEKLRQNHAAFGLALNWDEQGRIVPTEDTCADIIQALLDHRLLSPFSDAVYAVPDATPVSTA